MGSTLPRFPKHHGCHEGDEGDEGHEGEEGVDHRQGEVRTVGCVPWQQGEDPRGPEEDRPDEEQDREDREQEGQWQEGLRPHQGLDRGCAEGAQGAWRQRLPGGEEGLAALQEGQGALWPVNTAALERVSPLEAYFAGRPGVWGVPHLARDQWRVPPQHSSRIVILYTSF